MFQDEQIFPRASQPKLIQQEQKPEATVSVPASNETEKSLQTSTKPEPCKFRSNRMVRTRKIIS